MTAAEQDAELKRLEAKRDAIDEAIERLSVNGCPSNIIAALLDLRREYAIEIGKVLGATCSGGGA